MQRESISNAIAVGAINLVILLAVVAWMSGSKDSSGANTLQPIRIATGEWAPYSGEELPHFGIATAIVTEVLKNAGYSPNYEFMPWQLAEGFSQNNETNSEIRGTFPYLSSSLRRERFYYSEPLLSIDHSLYFNEDRISLTASPVLSANNTATEDKLRQLESSLNSKTLERLREEYEASSPEQKNTTFLLTLQLIVWLETQNISIVPIQGYAVKDILKPYISDDAPVSDTLAALKLLKSSDKKLIVLEASSVGDKLIKDNFPANVSLPADQNIDASTERPANNITIAPIRIPQYVYFILGRRNPHNKEVIDKFNAALVNLKATGTLEKIESRINAALSNQKYVRLSSFHQNDHLVGEKVSEQGKFIVLINGTKARIAEWNAALLNEHSNEPAPIESYKIKVIIEQGPHKGALVLIDSRSIEIP